jgi:succinyl-CoA:acetate CoA-transferase
MTLLGTAATGIVADYSLIDEVGLRYPFAVWDPVKQAINEGRMKFIDSHLSQVPEEVRQGYLGNVDTAVVEAVAVGEDWLIPSTIVGATPAYLEPADEVLVEVNHGQPLDSQMFHDAHRAGSDDTVPLQTPGERLDDQKLRFQPEKLGAVGETDAEPPGYPFRPLTDDEEDVVDHFREFVQQEVEDNLFLGEFAAFEIGVGTLGDAVSGSLSDVEFGDRDVYLYSEVLQDSVLDLLDEEVAGHPLADQPPLHVDEADQDGVDRPGGDLLLQCLEIEIAGHRASSVAMLVVSPMQDTGQEKGPASRRTRSVAVMRSDTAGRPSPSWLYSS